jgi:hypothetical protein
MATYSLPDVFVDITIPEPTPVIQSPGLPTCVVGEHYFVETDAFVSNVTDGESGTTNTYPNLPESQNVSGQDLEVDVSSDFAPTFYVVTDAGETIDVTDEMNATASDFTISGAMPEGGALFVNYRARDDRYAGTQQELLSVSTFDDLINLFGGPEALGPANPLGFAMYKAWSHSNIEVAGVAITNPKNADGTGNYSAAISNETAAYQSVLDMLKVHDVYMVIPLTFSEAVHSITEAHVDYMSSAGGGNQERRTIVVPNMDGEITVRRSDGFIPWYPINESPGGTAISSALDNANVGEETTVGGYRIVKAAEGNTNSDDYYIRDYVPSTNGTGETVTLDGGDYEVNFSGLMLAELDSSAVSPAAQRIQSSDSFNWTADDGTSVTGTIQTVPLPGHEKILEIDVGSAAPVESQEWAAVRSIDPATERDKFVRAYKSKAMGVNNERVVNLMPHYVGDIETGQDVPAYYVAAQLAAEASLTSVEPAGASIGVDQMGGFRDSTENLFRSVRYFTPSELDEIAGAGWTILANDRPGQQINTLHTLTTDTSALERMEFTLGVERDYLARFFRSELSEDTRQFRINESAIQALQLRAAEIATTLSSQSSQHYRYRDVSIEAVEQDEDQPDRVIYDVEAEHLYPYNQGKVRARIVT